MANDTKTEEKPLSLSARLLEKSVKRMEKNVADETDAMLKANQSPQQIISKLLQSLPEQPTKSEINQLIGDVGKVEIPTGEREGLLSGLLRGSGAGRKEITEPFGREEGVKLLQNILSIQKSLKTPEQIAAEKKQQAGATARGTAEVKQEFKTAEAGVAAESFQNDIRNLVQSFVDIPIKGRGQAGISAVGGFLGVGREEKARFASTMAVFPFRAAEFIAGQTGRALSDKDFERMQVLSQFKAGEGEAVLKGKLQALIDFTNTKLKAAKKPPIPSAEAFLKGIRGQAQPEAQKVFKKGEGGTALGIKFTVE